MADESYAPTPSTTFNRYKERGSYDVETIHNIFNTTSVVHVSFLPSPDDPFPVILPMIGQIGTYPGDDTAEAACYLHGYVSSRIVKLSGSHDDPGFPVCVTATKVDGYKLALTPFHHSYNYRSALLQGHAALVTDPAEKTWALELITDSVVPGRWAHSRPPDKGELAATHVIKISIVAASAKDAASVPADERKDLRNEAVANAFWAGVVPVWECFGEPVPAPYNKVKVPDHVAEFVKNENANSEEYAVWAAGNVPVKKKREDE
ncbi:uncharacterized protein J3D65DRAFT_610005 [Phyllosticta citribraziliensis]|uniref:Flavin-nucleotide-binding protein n=1 Tax=Phyllosticta citribraziliensis TaxID=989973 RepID=A0ABR1M9L1_9PEZI